MGRWKGRVTGVSDPYGARSSFGCAPSALAGEVGVFCMASLSRRAAGAAWASPLVLGEIGVLANSGDSILSKVSLKLVLRTPYALLGAAVVAMSFREGVLDVGANTRVCHSWCLRSPTFALTRNALQGDRKFS